MENLKNTNETAGGNRNSEKIQTPDYCPSCHNSACVELIDEGDEQDSDGTFGNYYFRCTICGRRTDSMDTPADSLESWNGNDTHFMGSCAILIPTANLRELCKHSQDCKSMCHACEKANELRVLYP